MSPPAPLFRSASQGEGLRVHLHRTRAFKTISARLVFHAPLDARTAARAAVPRVLARGTRRFPSLRSVQIELDRLYGASLSGDVRKVGERHTVQFFSDWVTDRIAGGALLDEMATLLAELLHEPARDAHGRLREPEVLQERKSLLDESKAVYDDKARYARHRLLEVMCAGEPFARPAIGRTEEIEGIGVAEVEAAHRLLLSKAPCDLFLVGDLRASDATRFAKRLALHRRQGLRIPRLARNRAAGRPRTVREKDSVVQAKLDMGFRTPITLGHKLYPALVLMNSLFGGTPISKLFKVVREKASLCYSVSSSLARSKGLLFVNAGIEAANYSRARRMILAQLAEMQKGIIAPEAEEQARSMLASALGSLRDSPGGLIDFALDRTIHGMPVDLEGLIADLARVRRADITRAARSLHLDTVFFLRD